MFYKHFYKLKKTIEELKDCDSIVSFFKKLDEFYNQLEINYSKYIKKIKKNGQCQLDEINLLEKNSSEEFAFAYNLLKENIQKIIKYAGNNTINLFNHYDYIEKNTDILPLTNHKEKYLALLNILNHIAKKAPEIDNIINKFCKISKDGKIVDKTFCPNFHAFQNKIIEIQSSKEAWFTLYIINVILKNDEYLKYKNTPSSEGFKKFKSKIFYDNTFNLDIFKNYAEILFKAIEKKYIFVKIKNIYKFIIENHIIQLLILILAIASGYNKLYNFLKAVVYKITK